MSALLGRLRPAPRPRPLPLAPLTDDVLALLVNDLHQLARDLTRCPPSTARAIGLDIADAYARLLVRVQARR